VTSIKEYLRSGTRTFIAVAVTVAAVHSWIFEDSLPDGLLEVLMLVYAFYFSTDITRWLVEQLLKQRVTT